MKTIIFNGKKWFSVQFSEGENYEIKLKAEDNPL